MGLVRRTLGPGVLAASLQQMLRQDSGTGLNGGRLAVAQAIAPTPLRGTSHARHTSSLAYVFLVVLLGSIALGQHLLEEVLVSHVKDIAMAELRIQQAAQELTSTAVLAQALASRWQMTMSRPGRELALRAPDGRLLIGSPHLLPLADCAAGQPCNRWLRRKVMDADGTQDWLGFAYTLPDGGQYVTAYDIRPMVTRTHPVPLAAGMGVYLALLLSLAAQLLVGVAKVRRVDQIRAAMWRFARGDADGRVPVGRSDDEFDRLAEDINQALDRIAKLMDEVRHATNHIAHELRTPLLRLQQRLSDLAQACEGDEQLAQELGRADDEVQRIQYLFTAVMRISEIETGRCAHDWQPVDLVQLMDDLLDYCGVMAQARDIEVQTRVAPQLQLMGDRTLLLQALVNLFDNAVKYAPAGSRLWLSAQAADGHVVLAVADEGPGMPDALHGRAVQRFQRFNSDRRVRGHGLGLALVKAVAELHGGKLTLRAHRPGHAVLPGLQALIILPVASQT